MSKIEWNGKIITVQPRIRLNRSFDERTHSYLGYSLRVSGVTSDGLNEFWVGIGKGAQQKIIFQIGMSVEGKAQRVLDTRKETVDFYKVSGVVVNLAAADAKLKGPPWSGIAPELEVYRARGHRRLSKKTYDTNCIGCIWGCNMPVIITIDQWKPENKQFRYETFCYGPKSCRFYKSGPTRKVAGRNEMTWEEENWVDEDATAHRRPDE